MQIIDFRCRPPFGNLARDWIFTLDDTPGNPGLRSKYRKMGMELPPSLLDGSMEAFLRECEQEDISKTVVPLRRLQSQNNDDLAALLRAYPEKFLGFAGVQPVEDGIAASLAQIARHVLDGPCVGVYMEPGLDPHPWAVDDTAVFPLYEFCERHALPLCLLYGGVFHRKAPPSYDLYEPRRIERVARRFPELRILLSHACWPFTALACALALNWTNVWLSPDGFMIDHPGAQDYVTAANYRLQDKIIFGSLYPSMPLDFAVARYKRLLRPEVWAKIFYANAMDFLEQRPPACAAVEAAPPARCCPCAPDATPGHTCEEVAQ